MKKSLRIWILCLIILIGAFSSCVNSLDTLYDQYNENFKKNTMLELLAQQMQQQAEEIKKEKVLTPNDEGFNELDLLYEEYFVYDDGTLNLAAPYDCYDYQWVLRDPANGYKEVKVQKFWEGSGYDKREFIIYLPESGLQAEKTYQLTLSLRNKALKPFADSCQLHVYNHYNNVVLDEDRLKDLN